MVSFVKICEVEAIIQLRAKMDLVSIFYIPSLIWINIDKSELKNVVA
jgi:hypothetical protein